MEILGVYLVNFKQNTGGEINGMRYGIIVSELAKKDKTLLVIPITGKKKGVKYRGGITIDNTKYLSEPTYEKGFAKIRKIREIDRSRIKSEMRFQLDPDDKKRLGDKLKEIVKLWD